MKKYHFLPAKLSKYPFNLLLKEANTEKITWKISSEKRKNIHKINIGDICYIYYSGLPDQSNRIILRGEVIETDYGKGPDEKLMYDDKLGILGIKIKVRAVSLKDNNKYSREQLRKKYFNPKFNFHGYVNLNKPQYEDLVKQLNEEYDNKLTDTLTELTKYFDRKYCLCELLAFDNTRKHETFIEENGFNYIEHHHLIERKNKKLYQNKNPKIEELIDNDNNIFRLCPNCHKEIHHGKPERKKEMLKYLYIKDPDKKKFLDDNFAEIKSGKSTLDWLYELYGVDNKKDKD